MSCFAINGNCTTVARYLYMDPVTLNAQFGMNGSLFPFIDRE